MIRRFGKLTLGFAGAAALLGLAPDAKAQTWTQAYTSPTKEGNCDALPAAIATDTSQFAIDQIVNRQLFTNPQPARIVKMAFWMNPATKKADIIIAEKGGTPNPATPSRILWYDASATPSPTLKVIGTINAYVGHNESGVWGVAINPQTFNQDNFLYVLYATGNSVTPSLTNGWRLSRFKLHPTTREMDMGSEKQLLNIPAGTASRWHTGTSMRFDNFGNLYIGLADNEALANGPGNTADLRGGILRIKPDTADARGYTIPAGNFGEYWASQWQSQGLTARAAAYRDTNIVKAQIYVKGSRNPYSFGIDPNRLGWLAWAECGPDQQRGEEHNFTTKPVFGGWPFWAADSVRQLSFAGDYSETPEPSSTSQWSAFNYSGMTTALPINNWAQAAGYDTLPPMHWPYAVQKTQGCAIGGPILRYDGRIEGAGKLPPHLDNVAISFNMSGHNWYAQSLHPDSGKPVGNTTTVFTMTKSSARPSLRNQAEIIQAPDGMLYGVDWGQTCCGERGLVDNEGIVRLRYKGTCQDPGRFPSTTAIAPDRDLPHARTAEWLRVGGKTLSITAPGPHEASILDVAGRVVHVIRGEGHKTYSLPSVGAGIHVLRVKTSTGIVSRPLASGL